MRLAALIPRRQAFLAAGAVTYATVFALFLIFERPGLGVGHGFYLAVIFVSLARGPIVGVGAGLLATVLYAIGISINPHVSPAQSLPLPPRFVASPTSPSALSLAGTPAVTAHSTGACSS